MVYLLFFFLMIRRPPRSTRTDTLFPYTTLFRSAVTSVSGRWSIAVGGVFDFPSRLRRRGPLSASHKAARGPRFRGGDGKDYNSPGNSRCAAPGRSGTSIVGGAATAKRRSREAVRGLASARRAVHELPAGKSLAARGAGRRVGKGWDSA